MTSLKKISKSRGTSVVTKIRLLKALAWPVTVYGLRAGQSRREMKHTFRAFEMKGLRQILWVSWTEKRSNDLVLQKLGLERSFLEIVKTQKMEYYGFVLRKPEVCLEKQILQRTTPEARGRGRPRTM
jgi:hypothetical protein